MRRSQAHSRIGPSASRSCGKMALFLYLWPPWYTRQSQSTAEHRASAPDALEHTPQRHCLRLLVSVNAAVHHGFHQVSSHPTTSHSLLPFAVTSMWDEVGCSQASVTSSAGAGGSEAVAPGPADPEIETRACQPRRDKSITRTAGHSSARGTLCAARGCTHVVGGSAVGPRFVSSYPLASASENVGGSGTPKLECEIVGLQRSLNKVLAKRLQRCHGMCWSGGLHKGFFCAKRKEVQEWSLVGAVPRQEMNMCVVIRPAR